MTFYTHNRSFWLKSQALSVSVLLSPFTISLPSGAWCLERFRVTLEGTKIALLATERMSLVRFLRRTLPWLFLPERRHIPYYHDLQSDYKDLLDNHLRCGSVASIDCNCHSGLKVQLDHCNQWDQDSEISESTDYVVGGGTPAQVGADNRYFVGWRRASIWEFKMSTCIVSLLLCIQSPTCSILDPQCGCLSLRGVVI
jgi:hypothetical protein